MHVYWINDLGSNFALIYFGNERLTKEESKIKNNEKSHQLWSVERRGLSRWRREIRRNKIQENMYTMNLYNRTKISIVMQMSINIMDACIMPIYIYIYIHMCHRAMCAVVGIESENCFYCCCFCCWWLTKKPRFML